jgi:hypothetical protein
MATAGEYRQRIAAVTDWAAVRAFWQRIVQQDTPDWEPGKAFEYLVLRAFELDGATVRYPFTVEVFGEIVEQIDGAIHTGGMNCLTECKDTADAVSTGAIAKLRNQLMRRPAGTVGVAFSRTGFTDAAIALAHFCLPQPVLLWSGDEWAWCLDRQDPVARLRRKLFVCYQEGRPDHDTSVGERP